MMRSMPVLAAAGLFAASLAASAETLYFNYQAGSAVASGIFDATYEGNDTYSVTGISGFRDGVAITGLSDYNFPSNVLQLNKQEPVDSYGISYQLASGLEVNLFGSQDFRGYVREDLSDGTVNPPMGGFQLNVTTSPTTVSAEPSSFALFGTGLLGLAGTVRRSRRAKDAACSRAD